MIGKEILYTYSVYNNSDNDVPVKYLMEGGP